MKLDEFLEKYFFKISFIFSIFILFYVVIKSDIIQTTEKVDYYLPYFFFSLTLFILSFFIKFTRKENKIYIFLIVLSLVLSLYLSSNFISTFPEEVIFSIFLSYVIFSLLI